ncbi:g11523 [Coccomyxa viridis]|uniref:G11523 protein n=1 Tax=Coccomyxa viridis TaxID=1274662 RepID=A0ABP1G9B3_9CHLO
MQLPQSRDGWAIPWDYQATIEQVAWQHLEDLKISDCWMWPSRSLNGFCPRDSHAFFDSGSTHCCGVRGIWKP